MMSRKMKKKLAKYKDIIKMADDLALSEIDINAATQEGINTKEYYDKIEKELEDVTGESKALIAKHSELTNKIFEQKEDIKKIKEELKNCRKINSFKSIYTKPLKMFAYMSGLNRVALNALGLFGIGKGKKYLELKKQLKEARKSLKDYEDEKETLYAKMIEKIEEKKDKEDIFERIKTNINNIYSVRKNDIETIIYFKTNKNKLKKWMNPLSIPDRADFDTLETYINNVKEKGYPNDGRTSSELLTWMKDAVENKIKAGNAYTVSSLKNDFKSKNFSESKRRKIAKEIGEGQVPIPGIDRRTISKMARESGYNNLNVEQYMAGVQYAIENKRTIEEGLKQVEFFNEDEVFKYANNMSKSLNKAKRKVGFDNNLASMTKVAVGGSFFEVRKEEKVQAMLKSLTDYKLDKGPLGSFLTGFFCNVFTDENVKDFKEDKEQTGRNL